MTGLAETEHVVAALEAGGVDYVTKPITPEECSRGQAASCSARLTQSARARASTLHATIARATARAGTCGRRRWLKLLPSASLRWRRRCVCREPMRCSTGCARQVASRLPSPPPCPAAGSSAQLQGRAGEGELLIGCPRTSHRGDPAEFSRDSPRRARGSVLDGQGQDQPRHRAHSGPLPAHRRQAPRAGCSSSGSRARTAAAASQ